MLISRRYSEKKNIHTRKQAYSLISAYDTQWSMTQRKTRLVLYLARFVFKIPSECGMPRARVNINNKTRARKQTRTDLWIVNSITGFAWQPRTGSVLCSFVRLSRWTEERGVMIVMNMWIWCRVDLRSLFRPSKPRVPGAKTSWLDFFHYNMMLGFTGTYDEVQGRLEYSVDDS